MVPPPSSTPPGSDRNEGEPTPRVRGRAPKEAGAPHGRAEVEAALIAAGAELFAERGPNAVSVRELAQKARVNPGLVHRYFGSKDGLLGAVLEHLAAEVATTVGTPGDARNWAAGGPVDRHWRVLARAILDGHDPATLQDDFPATRRLIEGTRAGSGAEEETARLQIAQVIALNLGWRMFEPFLVAATGLDRDRSDIDAALLATSRQITGTWPPPDRAAPPPG